MGATQPTASANKGYYNYNERKVPRAPQTKKKVAAASGAPVPAPAPSRPGAGLRLGGVDTSPSNKKSGKTSPAPRRPLACRVLQHTGGAAAAAGEISSSSGGRPQTSVESEDVLISSLSTQESSDVGSHPPTTKTNLDRQMFLKKPGEEAFDAGAQTVSSTRAGDYLTTHTLESSTTGVLGGAAVFNSITTSTTQLHDQEDEFAKLEASRSLSPTATTAATRPLGEPRRAEQQLSPEAISSVLLELGPRDEHEVDGPFIRMPLSQMEKLLQEKRGAALSRRNDYILGIEQDNCNRPTTFSSEKERSTSHVLRDLHVGAGVQSGAVGGCSERKEKEKLKQTHDYAYGVLEDHVPVPAPAQAQHYRMPQSAPPDRKGGGVDATTTSSTRRGVRMNFVRGLGAPNMNSTTVLAKRGSFEESATCFPSTSPGNPKDVARKDDCPLYSASLEDQQHCSGTGGTGSPSTFEGHASSPAGVGTTAASSVSPPRTRMKEGKGTSSCSSSWSSPPPPALPVVDEFGARGVALAGTTELLQQQEFSEEERLIHDTMSGTSLLRDLSQTSGHHDQFHLVPCTPRERNAFGSFRSTSWSENKENDRTPMIQSQIQRRVAERYESSADSLLFQPARDDRTQEQEGSCSPDHLHELYLSRCDAEADEAEVDEGAASSAVSEERSLQTLPSSCVAPPSETAQVKAQVHERAYSTPTAPGEAAPERFSAKPRRSNSGDSLAVPCMIEPSTGLSSASQQQDFPSSDHVATGSGGGSGRFSQSLADMPLQPIALEFDDEVVVGPGNTATPTSASPAAPAWSRRSYLSIIPEQPESQFESHPESHSEPHTDHEDPLSGDCDPAPPGTTPSLFPPESPPPKESAVGGAHDDNSPGSCSRDLQRDPDEILEEADENEQRPQARTAAIIQGTESMQRTASLQRTRTDEAAPAPVPPRGPQRQVVQQLLSVPQQALRSAQPAAGGSHLDKAETTDESINSKTSEVDHVPEEFARKGHQHQMRPQNYEVVEEHHQQQITLSDKSAKSVRKEQYSPARADEVEQKQIGREAVADPDFADVKDGRLQKAAATKVSWGDDFAMGLHETIKSTSISDSTRAALVEEKPPVPNLSVAQTGSDTLTAPGADVSSPARPSAATAESDNAAPTSGGSVQDPRPQALSSQVPASGSSSASHCYTAADGRPPVTRELPLPGHTRVDANARHHASGADQVHQNSTGAPSSHGVPRLNTVAPATAGSLRLSKFPGRSTSTTAGRTTSQHSGASSRTSGPRPQQPQSGGTTAPGSYYGGALGDEVKHGGEPSREVARVVANERFSLLDVPLLDRQEGILRVLKKGALSLDAKIFEMRDRHKVQRAELLAALDSQYPGLVGTEDQLQLAGSDPPGVQQQHPADDESVTAPGATSGYHGSGKNKYFGRQPQLSPAEERERRIEEQHVAQQKEVQRAKLDNQQLMIREMMANSLPFLHGLDDTQRDQLAQHMTGRLYGRGRTVYKQGEPGDRFFIILAGVAHVVVKDEKEIRVGDQIQLRRPVKFSGKQFPVGTLGVVDKYDKNREIPYTVTVFHDSGGRKDNFSGHSGAKDFAPYMDPELGYGTSLDGSTVAVSRGRVWASEICLCGDEAADRYVTTLFPGDYFGETVMLNPRERPETVVVGGSQDLAVMTITRNAFRSVGLPRHLPLTPGRHAIYLAAEGEAGAAAPGARGTNNGGPPQTGLADNGGPQLNNGGSGTRTPAAAVDPLNPVPGATDPGALPSGSGSKHDPAATLDAPEPPSASSLMATPRGRQVFRSYFGNSSVPSVPKSDADRRMILRSLARSQPLRTLLDLKQAHLERLADIAVPRTYKCGDVVIQAGDLSFDRMLLVKSGSFLVSQPEERILTDPVTGKCYRDPASFLSRQEKERQAQHLQENQGSGMFGEYTVLYGVPPLFTVECESEEGGACFEFPRAAFKVSLLAGEQSLARSVLEALGDFKELVALTYAERMELAVTGKVIPLERGQVLKESRDYFFLLLQGTMEVRGNRTRLNPDRVSGGGLPQNNGGTMPQRATSAGRSFVGVADTAASGILKHPAGGAASVGGDEMNTVIIPPESGEACVTLRADHGRLVKLFADQREQERFFAEERQIGQEQEKIAERQRRREQQEREMLRRKFGNSYLSAEEDPPKQGGPQHHQARTKEAGDPGTPRPGTPPSPVGEVEVLDVSSSSLFPKSKLHDLQWYGERALLRENHVVGQNEARVSSFSATVFAVPAPVFNKIISPMISDRLLSAGATRRSTQLDGREECEVLKDVDMFQGWTGIRFDSLSERAILGSGGFGRVSLYQHGQSGSTFALKTISKQFLVRKRMESAVFREKKILLLCKCRFIVRTFQTFRDLYYLHFLMEVCLGGELFYQYHRYRYHGSITKAKFYSATVITAFVYLHNKGVLYRDLKPENLLLDHRGCCKLTDMGLAKIIGPEKTFTTCGTPDYFAPEVVRHLGQTMAVDWWCLGVLIYELMTGHAPFEAGDTQATMARICKGVSRVNFDHFQRRAPDCVDLVVGLLQSDPLRRLPMRSGKGELSALRSHPWYKHFPWVEMWNGKVEAPFIPKVTHNRDTSNFRSKENEHARRNDEGLIIRPAEPAGWDKDF